LDIVTCVPSVACSTNSQFGPEDSIHALASLLSKVGGSKSPRLNMLHARMSQARSAIEPTSISLFPGQRRTSNFPAKAGSPYQRPSDNTYSRIDSDASTLREDPILLDNRSRVTATNLPWFLCEEIVPTQSQIDQPLDAALIKVSNLRYVHSAEDYQSYPYWPTSAL
jgi:hypothetical protein